MSTVLRLFPAHFQLQCLSVLHETWYNYDGGITWRGSCIPQWSSGSSNRIASSDGWTVVVFQERSHLLRIFRTPCRIERSILWGLDVFNRWFIHWIHDQHYICIYLEGYVTHCVCHREESEASQYELAVPFFWGACDFASKSSHKLGAVAPRNFIVKYSIIRPVPSCATLVFHTNLKGKRILVFEIEWDEMSSKLATLSLPVVFWPFSDYLKDVSVLAARFIGKLMPLKVWCSREEILDWAPHW